jgi:c-di-GMP-binding flagellar brake protein YcgR
MWWQGGLSVSRNRLYGSASIAFAGRERAWNRDTDFSKGAQMDERRKYKRVDIEIDVDYQISKRQEWLRGTMKNLSGGGICLISKKSYGLSNQLCLRFRVPDSNSMIEISGNVVWEDFDMDHDFYSIGIEFMSAVEKDRALIEKYIEHETFDMMKKK